MRRGRRRPRRHRSQLFAVATPPSVARLRPRAGEVPAISGAKLVSGPFFLLLAGVLCYLFAWYDFYVYDAEVVGATHLSPQEVFEASGVNEVSIFYVRPVEVEARLEKLPWVKEALVRCSFPNQVRITLHERKVAFVWQRDDRLWGVDADGTGLPLSQAPEGVLWVEDNRLRPIDEGAGQQLVASALAVRDLMPEVSRLACDSTYGLTFQSAEGCVVRLGQDQIARKVVIWRAMQSELAARGIRPSHVDLRFPSSPCYGLTGAEELPMWE